MKHEFLSFTTRLKLDSRCDQAWASGSVQVHLLWITTKTKFFLPANPIWIQMKSIFVTDSDHTKKQQLQACVVSLDIRNKFHLARFISHCICISIQMVLKDCPSGPNRAANLSVLNSLKGDTALEQEEILQGIPLIARI